MTTVACTCRQIYVETALFYYELSTFSFGPRVLEQWMKNRAEGQKQVITELHAEYCDLEDQFYGYFQRIQMSWQHSNLTGHFQGCLS